MKYNWYCEIQLKQTYQKHELNQVMGLATILLILTAVDGDLMVCIAMCSWHNDMYVLSDSSVIAN